jgi:hypothetical protein
MADAPSPELPNNDRGAAPYWRDRSAIGKGAATDTSLSLNSTIHAYYEHRSKKAA